MDPPILDGHNSCEPSDCTDEDATIILHHTLTKPVIRIGGVKVPEENITFSGLSVGSVGVNEVVFEIPAGMPTAPDVSLTLGISGVISKDDVTMAVE